ncbi:MAG: DUF169 domain-containing protein [Deltaproteobacteria bacterium]|jgi:hypothetical protein|nr:DUF169 domain-containing protein [Deltaproteobacteria bacterium]
MRSIAAESAKLKYPPLGLYRSDGPAPGSKQFSETAKFKPSGACSMTLVEKAFKDGTPCAFSTGTVHCLGGIRGFGLAPPAFSPPGGAMGSVRLVSSGNSRCEEGRAALDELKALGATAERLELFSEGEGFKRDPELLAASFAVMPKIPPIEGCLNLAPLSGLKAPPEVVVFLADAQQLSALTVLAGYSRPGFDHVAVPFCAACMAIAVFPLAERGKPSPKAIVGLMDVHARKIMRRLVGRDLVTFSVPWEMFEEM